MRLLHDAVLVNAGSYVMSPKSLLEPLICRRSRALMVPIWMGIS
jgi:hypothetical protein